METIKDKDIRVERRPNGGFFLSYVTDAGDYYRRCYIDYSVKEAKTLFKEYIYQEDGKSLRNMDTPLTYNDVMLGALRCICGHNMAAARELLASLPERREP